MTILKYILSAITIISTTLIYAQSTDPVLLRVDDVAITKSDFEYAYKKDQNGEAGHKQSPDQFLQSYINFKLNVQEALRLGYDKDISFIKEYSSYMEQLEKPYLTDSIPLISVAEKSYERLKENIEISHIFIKLPQGNILPKDTVDAYNRIVSIYKLADKENGASFESLAEKFSEDSISKYSRVPGYLGWRTAVSLPYSFEEAMYTTPVGSVSKPVRTEAGYHIIKVHNKRPDIGQVLIAHILLRYPLNPTQAQKDSTLNIVHKLHEELENGTDFNKLCAQYSSDLKTASGGGVLGWFGVNRPLPPALESAILGIKEIGTITPFDVRTGIDIVRLLDKAELLPWENMKEDLLKATQGNDRNEVVISLKVNRLAESYPYEINRKTYNGLEEVANQYSFLDSTFFKKIEPISDNLVLKVGDVSYSVKDFIFFIEKNPSTNYNVSTDMLQYKFKDFILDRLIEAQRSDLFNKYPEFRYLSQEYHDGILYFNIMDEKVWSKAQAEKDALQDLFGRNPQKYAWDKPKFKGYVMHIKNKKVAKQVKNIIGNNKSSEDLRQVLLNSLDTDSMDDVIIEKGLWGKGENPYVDRIMYHVKNSAEVVGYPELIVDGKLISSPEDYEDVYGQLVAEYQSLIEKQWIEELRKKHTVEVNESVFKTIK
ncbi:peptidylprolyl isomerase [Dysgonomonas sp. OttesenSCG-928-M03]|nr:peptidylprolyl isomerase [Dysgonomonas sp. OttesenSCG-928-M03]